MNDLENIKAKIKALKKLAKNEAASVGEAANAIKLAKTQDYQSFFKQEMMYRKKLFYPPYCYIVSIKVVSTDYELAKNESNSLAYKLKQNLKNTEVLGPSIGSIFKVKNTYRFGITLKYKKEDNLYAFLDKILDYYKSNTKITIEIDFNPVIW